MILLLTLLNKQDGCAYTWGAKHNALGGIPYTEVTEMELIEILCR